MLSLTNMPALAVVLSLATSVLAAPLAHDDLSRLVRRGQPISICPTSMGAYNIANRLWVYCPNADYQIGSQQILPNIGAIGDCVALCARTSGCANAVYDHVRPSSGMLLADEPDLPLLPLCVVRLRPRSLRLGSEGRSDHAQLEFGHSV